MRVPLGTVERNSDFPVLKKGKEKKKIKSKDQGQPQPHNI